MARKHELARMLDEVLWLSYFIGAKEAFPDLVQIARMIKDESELETTKQNDEQEGKTDEDLKRYQSWLETRWSDYDRSSGRGGGYGDKRAW